MTIVKKRKSKQILNSSGVFKNLVKLGYAFMHISKLYRYSMNYNTKHSSRSKSREPAKNKQLVALRKILGSQNIYKTVNKRDALFHKQIYI
jgi:hypothetical protein